jgi:hypothetical protein
MSILRDIADVFRPDEHSTRDLKSPGERTKQFVLSRAFDGGNAHDFSTVYHEVRRAKAIVPLIIDYDDVLRLEHRWQGGHELW